MCTRITIPEAQIDDIVCNHREALDLAIHAAQRILGQRARQKAATPTEAVQLNIEYMAALFLLLRIARHKSGVTVSPWR